jgi:Skp family chaperone for outer membrane proteins
MIKKLISAGTVGLVLVTGTVSAEESRPSPEDRAKRIEERRARQDEFKKERRALEDRQQNEMRTLRDKCQSDMRAMRDKHKAEREALRDKLKAEKGN